MAHTSHLLRHVPYNATSADDAQAVALVLGEAYVPILETLRGREGTGRSYRAVLRTVGELLVHRRNPYLFEELLRDSGRRRRLLRTAEADLHAVAHRAATDPAVVQLVEGCRQALAAFRADTKATPALRRALLRTLGPLVGRSQVRFDPFTRVAHATDASDWRLHLPLAVVTPDTEDQVAPLLAALGRLGLKAIPRGGGTGLTGGAIPLVPHAVVVNLERLHRLRGIRRQAHRLPDGREVEAAVLEAEAGLITEQAMAAAEAEGLVFATDPTSAWASTLGGNIAENAGGKACVRWGTCLDNLLAWRMALPTGRWITVHRTDHGLRKIRPEDTATFEVRDEGGAVLRTLAFRGGELRRPGLWKDITWKAMGGLPGLQKEGTDGVITSATFVLHRAYPVMRTLCLEFFGQDMEEASRVILALSRAFPDPEQGGEALLALEHFDREYVEAIAYRTKASRPQAPLAVLLVDLGAATEAEAERGVARVQAALEGHPETEVAVARDAAEARAFWADRKRLGAIARRTNAFKLNEDVVIPLEALAPFARFVEAFNAEAEREAQLRFVAAAEARLESRALAARCQAARAALGEASPGALRGLVHLDALRQALKEGLADQPALADALEAEHQQARDHRLVLATHMHAGDGNVHVNIPVHSSDPDMLRRAHAAVDRLMAEVVALGGAISGEHGIGVTKLKYLDPVRIEELRLHRAALDPGGLMHPGALEDPGVLHRLYTPSFRLLEVEARILRHGSLEALSRRVARCIRCGKCKGGCSMHHPARSLFFHPRNKNLAVGALLEALLYDTQRWRSTGFELLAWMREVADHCTLCHKCAGPCPVDIDTAEVSLEERRLLVQRGFKRTPLLTGLTLRYLDSRSRMFNRLFRATVVRMGGRAQRFGAQLARPFQPKDGSPRLYPMRLLRSSLPAVPRRDFWSHLPPCGPDQALCLEPEGEATATVFYFPGCGSERLHATIALAALHLLLATGTRVVLPPPHLCCGFPAHANARRDLHARTELRDTVLFAQLRRQFGHLTFDACVVTCGTCREGLLGMEADQLFGGRVMDATAYVASRGLRLEGTGPALYHAPCHDSLEGRAAAVLATLGGFGPLRTVPHCCSEAGTLALSRPDISDALLQRKRASLEDHGAREALLLTNCPSCLNGLGRCQGMGVRAQHLAVALAERLSGPDWKLQIQDQFRRAHRMPLY